MKLTIFQKASADLRFAHDSFDISIGRTFGIRQKGKLFEALLLSAEVVEDGSAVRITFSLSADDFEIDLTKNNPLEDTWFRMLDEKKIV